MSNTLKVIELQAIEAATWELDAQRVELIRHSIMKGATALELDLFLDLCKAKRLDPLTRQIYAIKTSQGWQYFASIDGLRVIAQRSGEYAGQVGPLWCGQDGEWVDVWLQPNAPLAAKVGVLRTGWTEPMWGVATMKSYGKTSPIWGKMADVMLAKCAESVALRKAFPDDLSGLYVREEYRDAEEVVEYDNTPGNSDAAHDTAPTPINGGKIRPAQVKRINELCDELLYTPEGRRQTMAHLVGTSDYNKMSENQAAIIIHTLEIDASSKAQQTADDDIVEADWQEMAEGDGPPEGWSHEDWENATKGAE